MFNTKYAKTSHKIMQLRYLLNFGYLELFRIEVIIIISNNIIILIDFLLFQVHSLHRYYEVTISYVSRRCTYFES